MEKTQNDNGKGGNNKKPKYNNDTDVSAIISQQLDNKLSELTKKNEEKK